MRQLSNRAYFLDTAEMWSLDDLNIVRPGRVAVVVA